MDVVKRLSLREFGISSRAFSSFAFTGDVMTPPACAKLHVLVVKVTKLSKKQDSDD